MEVRPEIKYRCRKYKKENLLKITEAEQVFKDFLESNNIAFKFQYQIFSRQSFILIDFVLTKQKIAVEIDGSSHKERNKSWQSYNKWRERLIAKKGLTLVRLWNDDILNNSDSCRKFKAEILSAL